jgi:hypothetical protein
MASRAAPAAERGRYLPMPLDIGLADPQSGPPSMVGPIVQFCNDDKYGDDTDGYYSFIYKFFYSIAEKTGQYIDLYGAAELRGDDLPLLRQTLLEVRQLVATQPERWSVHTGTSSMPNATPPVPPWGVFKEVERSKFLSMVDTLIAIVERAHSTGGAVVCFGD